MLGDVKQPTTYGLLAVTAIANVLGVAWMLFIWGSAEPDRVTQVTLRCEALDANATPLSGEACKLKQAAGTGYASRNRRFEVTVRTDGGDTYTVERPPEVPIEVGQKWP